MRAQNTSGKTLQFYAPAYLIKSKYEQGHRNDLLFLSCFSTWASMPKLQVIGKKLHQDHGLLLGYKD